MGKKSTVRYVNHCLNLLSDDGVEGNRKNCEGFKKMT